MLLKIRIYRKTGSILRSLVLFWCFYFANGASERHLPFSRRAGCTIKWRGAAPARQILMKLGRWALIG
jgi:hypothetical protein